MRPRALLSMLRMELAAALQFRAAYFLRAVMEIFWGIVMVAIISAFYRFGAGETPGVSMEQAVSMVWLSQIFIAFTSGRTSSPWRWERISSGDIALDLLRPHGLYAYMYAQNLCYKIGKFVPFALPLTLVAFLSPEGYRLLPPASPAALAAFVLSMSTGALLSSACEMLVMGALMDVRFGRNIAYMVGTVMSLLAGGFVPLQLFPDALQTFLRLQPFAGTLDLPARLWAGTAPPGDVFAIVGIQLFWTIFLVALGALWMRSETKKLVLQGG